MESRKPFAEQLIARFEAKRQCQGYYQILPTQREVINIFGDYYKNMTDNKQQFTARDINVHNSPGTNVGIENVSTDVANNIQQLPDSNNKSVLQQLQKEIEQNDKLSAQDKEDALYQIQVLANMSTTQLTPAQRSTLRVARDFLIGFGAGMFANLVSKFVIP